MTLLQDHVTPEELLRMPDASGFELIDGELVERQVSREANLVAARIIAKLVNASDATGEAEVYTSEMGYRCFADRPGLVRKGDASVVRKERLAAVGRNPGHMPIPADLIVEVVSPNDLFYNVSEKVRLYLDNGFGQVWVVDPTLRTVAAHRLHAAPIVYRLQDEITAEPALAAFRCRVSEFFDRTLSQPVGRVGQ